MSRPHRWLPAPQTARDGVVTAWARGCLLLLLVLVSLVSASCSGTSTALGPRSDTDEAIVPVVLRNPAPSTLDVSMTVQFSQQTSQASLMTDVSLGFFSGGHPVQFAGGERATCDGVDLPLKNRVAVFEVLHQAPLAQAAGATVHCDYAASGSDASVLLLIPPAPAFTSPPMGAHVVRSVQTVVTYRYDPATSTVFGLVALAPSSAVPKANALLNTPGPLQATVDTSSFAPGPGSLALWLSLTPQVTATGIPFKSLSASGTATVQVAVTWA
jgi:hypothetical protein